MSDNWYPYRDGLPCETCGHDKRESRVHIGLSAVGWVFLWRGWREADESPLGVAVITPGEWIDILTREVEQGAVIKDEYDQVKPLDEFLAFVRIKRGEGRGGPPLRHSDLNDAHLGGRDVRHIDGDDIAFYEFS